MIFGSALAVVVVLDVGSEVVVVRCEVVVVVDVDVVVSVVVVVVVMVAAVVGSGVVAGVLDLLFEAVG
jgi:hypothetical protein